MRNYSDGKAVYFAGQMLYREESFTSMQKVLIAR